jgi:hypothetical protein
MLYKLPFYCILGGVFWTIVLSLGLSAYSCSKALKHQPVGYSNIFQFFTFMWLGSVLLIVIGTVLGKLLGTQPWNEFQAVLDYFVHANCDGALYSPFVNYAFRPTLPDSSNSSNMTKKDCDAFIAHLKVGPYEQTGSNGSTGSNGKRGLYWPSFSSSRRGTQSPSWSFPHWTGRTPPRADAGAR